MIIALFFQFETKPQLKMFDFKIDNCFENCTFAITSVNPHCEDREIYSCLVITTGM